MTNTVKIIVEVEAEPGQPLGELTDELCADIRRSWPSSDIDVVDGQGVIRPWSQ